MTLFETYARQLLEGGGGTRRVHPTPEPASANVSEGYVTQFVFNEHKVEN